MTAGDWLGLIITSALLLGVAWITNNPDQEDPK